VGQVNQQAIQPPDQMVLSLDLELFMPMVVVVAVLFQ
jgi:hypothetical protein